MKDTRFRKGGVSIFIVVAACVLVAIVVASFIRIMIRDQQAATQQDLSQSAYDSSQAGVEDVKRALLSWQKACKAANASDPGSECARMTKVLNQDSDSQSCRFLAETFDIGKKNDKETIVQGKATSGQDDLNQAYTCVKVNVNTNDYLGEIPAGSSKIIPLKALSDFRKIRLSWFSEKDAGGSMIDLPSKTTPMLNMFSPSAKWAVNRPSVMRSQVILPGNEVNLGDNSSSLDADGGSRVAFLYPTSNAITNSQNENITLVPLNNTRRQFDAKTLSAVKCKSSISDGGYYGYACSAVLDLEENIAGDSGAVLRLAAQYGSTTNYKVEMINESGSVVQFNGVQPSVDSTGRANDQFRRVQSRLEIGGLDIPIPEYAVSSDGKFCKAMTIRDSTASSTVTCK